MLSLESFGWLRFWLDPHKHSVTFDDAVNCSPMAGQIILIFDPPSSPRKMLLLEVDYPFLKCFWNPFELSQAPQKRETSEATVLLEASSDYLVWIQIQRRFNHSPIQIENLVE